MRAPDACQALKDAVRFRCREGCGSAPQPDSGISALIHDYLDAAGHGTDDNGALFRPIRNNRTGRLEQAITGNGIYRWCGPLRCSVSRSAPMRCARPPPPMRSTPGRHRQGKVQEWLGHANPPRAFTTTAARGQRTARHSRWPTDMAFHEAPRRPLRASGISLTGNLISITFLMAGMVRIFPVESAVAPRAAI